MAPIRLTLSPLLRDKIEGKLPRVELLSRLSNARTLLLEQRRERTRLFFTALRKLRADNRQAFGRDLLEHWYEV
jgi:hypothetical protein